MKDNEVARWTGDIYDTEMDGIQMGAPAQHILNIIGKRAAQGWQFCASIPVEGPNKTEEDAPVLWGLVFQRKASPILVP